jgi:hypothetical protein
MSAKAKILDRVDKLYLGRTKSGGAATTTDGAAAAGQKVVPVADTTNLTPGKAVRINDGELMEVGVIASAQAGVSITLVENLVKSHAVGVPVVEQVVYDLGDVTEAGVVTTGTAQTTDVLSAMRRLLLTKLNGYVDLTTEFTLPGLTLDNLAVALAIPFDAIAGDGSTATPFSLVTDGNAFGTEKNQWLVAIGITQDGQPIRVEMWGVDFDYTGISIQLRRATLAGVPCKAAAAAGGVATTNASSYVGDVTRRATKGQIFEAFQEVGIWLDATVAPVATTLSVAADAGDTVITLADATGLAQGDWLRLASDDLVEFHQVEAINVNDVTLRSPIFRDHAAGTAAVKQQTVEFAGLSEDGATLAFGGSVTPVRLAKYRLSVGLKLGNATITLSFALTDYSLSNIARAFGIPQSAIASGRLPLGDLIGTATIDGFYTRGVLKDGTTSWINAWGCSQDLSNVQLALTNQGVPAIPIALLPSSGLHFLQSA